jgi:hypothetical protein
MKKIILLTLLAIVTFSMFDVRAGLLDDNDCGIPPTAVADHLFDKVIKDLVCSRINSELSEARDHMTTTAYFSLLGNLVKEYGLDFRENYKKLDEILAYIKKSIKVFDDEHKGLTTDV